MTAEGTATGQPDAASRPRREPDPPRAPAAAAGSDRPGSLADRFSFDLSAVVARRRARIAAELERNRRGEHTVPTWVLVVILLALVGGLALLIVLS